MLSLLGAPPPQQPLLSIVIPAYREARRLPGSLATLRRFMDAFPLAYEVIVMTESSPDGTWDAAISAAAGDSRIKVYGNFNGDGQQLRGGKGFAVRTGMSHATGRYRLFMDADLSTSLSHMLEFLARMMDPAQEPVSVLAGSRVEFLDQNRSWLRAFMSSTMRAFQAVTGTSAGLHDTQCGFKMFDARAAHLLFPLATVNGFAFDIELLLLAQGLSLPVHAMPVHWIDSEGSTVRPVADSARMVRAIATLGFQVRSRLRTLDLSQPQPESVSGRHGDRMQDDP